MDNVVFEDRIVIDALEGDVYVLTERHVAGTYDFVKIGARGPVELRNRETKKDLKISSREFARMRGEGTAVRTVREGVATGTERLTPFHMLDPNEQGISKTEKKRRERAQRKVVRAMTLQFYAERYDNHPTATTYEPTLQAFIEEAYHDAKERGLVEMPTTSPLRKALAKYGKPGNRPLGAFIDLRGKHKKSTRWFDWVLALKEKMIEAYWKPKINMDAVKCAFLDSFEIQRITFGAPETYEPPCDSTLNNWINESETQDRLAQKEDRRTAHKRWVGTVGSIEAQRPLQYVILDQTEIDLGLHIKNSAGELIRVQRAWLVYAMDVYSRMILGFYLTLEPPSVFSLMKCIKQVVRIKTDWEEKFGRHKGATDGWGWFNWLILDNGLENVGVSLKTAMAKLGADIMYASLRTPEHKAQLERTFGITNSLWHKLPGGIHRGPELRRKMAIDPISDAKLTLHEAEDRLIEFLVTCYHVESPRARREAPARRWAQGLLQFGRRTLDDARSLTGILGKYHRAWLTTSGISFDGEEFHDAVVVTRLMKDLLTRQKKRSQRKPGQTGVCRVNVFYNPMDCSQIHVLNDVTGELVCLSNVHKDACVGLSFAQAERLRAYARQQALEYHTTLQRAQARSKLFGVMLAQATEQGKPSKKRVRAIYAEQMALNPAAEVEEVFEDPSASGMKNTIPSVAPASRGLDHGLSPKDPIRGGKRGRGASAEGNTDRSQRTVDSIKNAALTSLDSQHDATDAAEFWNEETEEAEGVAAYMAALSTKSQRRW